MIGLGVVKRLTDVAFKTTGRNRFVFGMIALVLFLIG